MDFLVEIANYWQSRIVTIYLYDPRQYPTLSLAIRK
jgi:hypothetical protein